MHPVWHLRRILSLWAGYGAYTKDFIRAHQRWDEGQSPEKQRALVLRFMLLLHGALPPGYSCNRYYVHHQEIVNPLWDVSPIDSTRCARIFPRLYQQCLELWAKLRAWLGNQVSPETSRARHAKDGSNGSGDVAQRPHGPHPKTDQEFGKP